MDLDVLPRYVLDILDLDGTCLAGGAVRSLVDPSLGEPKDYDFYFVDQGSLRAADEVIQSRYFVDDVKENPWNTTYVMADGAEIQLIDCIWGTPMQILRTFDFRMSMVAISDCDGTFHERPGAVRDIHNRVLHFTGNLNFSPLTMKRFMRFYAQGWTVKNDQISEFLTAVAAAPESIKAGGPSA